jgi:hypothetical protein
MVFTGTFVRNVQPEVPSPEVSILNPLSLLELSFQRIVILEAVTVVVTRFKGVLGGEVRVTT